MPALSDDVFAAIRAQLCLPGDARIAEAIVRMRPGRPAVVELRIASNARAEHAVTQVLKRYTLQEK